jgi:hypothetical protein
VCTFTRVMVEPCMAAMLGFTSVRDRLRVMTVAKSWLVAVQRPQLWSNDVYQRMGWDVTSLPAVWLRGCIGGLSLISFDLSAPTAVASFMQFSRVRHLELYGSIPWRPPDKKVSMLQLRTALQALHLESLQILCMHPVVAESLFGSSEAITDPADVQTHPAIWSWSESLQRLRVDMCAVDDGQPNFVPNILTILSQRRWTRMSQLELAAFTRSDGVLKQEHVNAMQQLLTVDHLPSLVKLSVHWQLRRSVLSEHVLGILHRAVTSYLPLVRHFECDIVLHADGAGAERAGAIPLATYPPLSHLTLSPLDDLTPLTPQLGHSLQVLDLGLRRSMQRHSLLTIFEAIGAHTLPRLHTLAIPSKSELITDERATEHARIFEIISEMRALTRLHISHQYNIMGDDGPGGGGADEDDPDFGVSMDEYFQWIEYVHLFPSLSVLKFTKDCGARQDNKPRVVLVTSIAHVRHLEQLALQSDFSMVEIELLTKLLADRGAPKLITPPAAATSEPSDSPADDDGEYRLFSQAASLASMKQTAGLTSPLHTLHLEIDEAELNYTPLKSAVRHLARLGQFTSLTIVITPRYDTYFDADPTFDGEASDAYLSELINLRQLRALTISDCKHRLTDALLQRWCAADSFPQLRELNLNCYVRLDEADSDSDEEMDYEDEAESVVAPALSSDGLAQLLRLPQLHRLDIDRVSDLIVSGMIARVNHANACGRTPTLDLVIDGHTIHRHFTRLDQLNAASGVE